MAIGTVVKNSLGIKENYLELTNIPPAIFHPSRMLIMKDLILRGNAEFRQLKPAIPGMTDGNLASHLRILEQSKYIQTQKEIVDRKIRTSYEVTELGREAFTQLKKALTSFLEDGDMR